MASIGFTCESQSSKPTLFIAKINVCSSLAQHACALSIAHSRREVKPTAATRTESLSGRGDGYVGSAAERVRTTPNMTGCMIAGGSDGLNWLSALINSWSDAKLLVNVTAHYGKQLLRHARHDFWTCTSMCCAMQVRGKTLHTNRCESG